MGERSRAARLVVAGVGLALVAGCGADRAASPAWLPPSSYATLTTTDPLPARSPGAHTWVDPRIAEPPRADSRTAAAFVWSGSGAPTTTFGRVRVGELERLVRTDLTDVDLGRADMAVTTTLATPAEARGVAARVRSRLRQGSTRYGAPRDAVVVLGSSVVVRGIRTAAALRSVRGLLSRHAGGVLAEGDRYGEGAVVTDLSCRPTDPARARAVARDLADYAGTPHYFFLRPPWAQPSLTRTERLARSTYTRFNRVLEDAVADDPESQQLWFDYRRALQSGDSRWMRRLQRRLAERRLELSPSRLDGPYDKRTLASLRAQPLAVDAVTRWAARVGRRMGQLPLRNVSGEPVLARQSEFTAAPAMLDVRLAGRIDVSMFLPEGHFVPSLAALVLHLDRAGCTDVRYRLLDWDTVRAD